jgi:hypothetical protein
MKRNDSRIQVQLKPEEKRELKMLLAKRGRLRPDGRGDGLSTAVAKDIVLPYLEFLRKEAEEPSQRRGGESLLI